LPFDIFGRSRSGSSPSHQLLVDRQLRAHPASFYLAIFTMASQHIPQGQHTLCHEHIWMGIECNWLRSRWYSDFPYRPHTCHFLTTAMLLPNDSHDRRYCLTTAEQRRCHLCCLHSTKPLLFSHFLSLPLLPFFAPLPTSIPNSTTQYILPPRRPTIHTHLHNAVLHYSHGFPGRGRLR
jgi:hypothetical protein